MKGKKVTDDKQIELQSSESIEELDKLVLLSLLYDFYGALLKEQKREVFEDYILNDLSLSEIAQEKNMTRQGVYDIVKRCSKELTEYENKLLLIGKFSKTKEMVNQIHEIATTIRESGKLELIEKIELISNEILESL